MFEMSRLPTPIICVVIGEGGSGGALGIGVGDRVALLEFAYYSVISPEGCAGILWKSHTYAERAARALKLTSKDLSRLGVVDDVIEEPLGGAHRDHHQMAGAAEDVPDEVPPRAGGPAHSSGCWMSATPSSGGSGSSWSSPPAERRWRKPDVIGERRGVSPTCRSATLAPNVR